MAMQQKNLNYRFKITTKKEVYFIKNKIKDALVKAQAALEFLMTYGWAVLVVLVTIGVLAYFGILSPDMFLPQKCSLPSGITCLDYEVGSTRVNIALQNNFGETITIERIDIAKKDGNACSSIDSLLLQNNDKGIFKVLGCSNGNPGSKFDGQVNVTYTKESTLSHKMSGIIFSKIKETVLTELQILACEAADAAPNREEACNDGLADLGIVLKEECCQILGLCCGV